MFNPKHEQTSSKRTLVDRLDRSMTRFAIRTGSWIGVAETFLGIGNAKLAASSANAASTRVQPVTRCPDPTRDSPTPPRA